MANSNKVQKTDNIGNEDLADVSGSVSFPKGIPKCCGREMYASGGSFWKRPDGKNGDVERFWMCDVCKNEVVDVLA
jgi:hypothetical protein